MQNNKKNDNSDLHDAIEMLLNFTNKRNLTNTIAMLEDNLKGSDANLVKSIISQKNINQDILKAAVIVKKSISQIDVIIHAIGIINSLPYILDEDEKVQYLSLGAGNTGRNFDIETNKRIAEFKFINWTGKSDTIRQNTTFKDFFELAEYETVKKKYLYILDKPKVLRFFNNNRALKSVLSKNEATKNHFFSLYNNKYATVSQYYSDKKDIVKIIDLNEICPNLF